MSNTTTDAIATAHANYGSFLGLEDPKLTDRAAEQYASATSEAAWRYDMLNMSYLALLELRAIRASLGRGRAELRELPAQVTEKLAELLAESAAAEERDDDAPADPGMGTVVRLPITNPDAGSSDAEELPIDDDPTDEGPVHTLEGE